MRNIPKQPIPHPLAPEFDPLGLAERAKIARFAGKRQQVLGPAGGTSNPGESAPRISTVEILLDDLLYDRPEIAALIRFAPEDCKARIPARTGFRIRPGSLRNDGKARGREPSAPDAEVDRLPPWRENCSKNRANIMKKLGSSSKQAENPVPGRSSF